jgi:peptide/nickel transport system ATP-binding protein
MSELLQVKALSVALRTPRGPLRAVRDLDLSLASGQTLGIVGESGCGKSMTALALMGLQPEGAQVGGSIMLGADALHAYSEAQWCGVRGRRIGMIFQEPMTALNPVHTIGKQIAEPLRLHLNLTASQARERALKLLEDVQLPNPRERLDAYPHQLSGGQRQRVGIAMALACEPDVLIADEPTTALDVTVQAHILALISKLVAERGMGLVLISHDLGLIAKHVQRVAVMYGGSIIETGPVNDVFARPAHPYTRGLMAARPSLRGARGGRLATIAGTVPALHELGESCAFASRCSHAQAACTSGFPLLEDAPLHDDARHLVRCIRAKELGGAA